MSNIYICTWFQSGVGVILHMERCENARLVLSWSIELAVMNCLHDWPPTDDKRIDHRVHLSTRTTQNISGICYNLVASWLL